MDYPGWTVETTHPTEPGEGITVCETCLGMIPGTIAFAADWGSTAHSNQHTDSEGATHTVVVRQV